MSMPVSVFSDIAEKIFSFRYGVTLHVKTLVGGTPSDPNVAEGWIRTKMGLSTDELVQAEVMQVMADRGMTAEAAAAEVSKARHLTGFRRDFNSPLAREHQQRAMTTGFVFEGKRKIFTLEEALATFGELYVEGRHVKAMLKEAAMIAVGSGHVDGKKWGTTNKAMKGFLAEHLFVLEDQLPLEVTEPTEIVQSFVHTFRGSGIKYEEHVRDVEVKFTIVADYDFAGRDPEFFGKVFVIGEQNGLGASRSQGYGRFVVTRFERLK
jgi:hypothetical protein